MDYIIIWVHCIFPIYQWWWVILMMTSSNGNIFRVTGHLCGEFTSHRWIPITKASDADLWCFLLSTLEDGGWENNQNAGDLRRHDAHYDVSVMWSHHGIQYIWVISTYLIHTCLCACELCTPAGPMTWRRCNKESESQSESESKIMLM